MDAISPAIGTKSRSLVQAIAWHLWKDEGEVDRISGTLAALAERHFERLCADIPAELPNDATVPRALIASEHRFDDLLVGTELSVLAGQGGLNWAARSLHDGFSQYYLKCQEPVPAQAEQWADVRLKEVDTWLNDHGIDARLHERLLLGYERGIVCSELADHAQKEVRLAATQVTDALRRGERQARGRLQGDGRLESVPVDDWEALTIADRQGHLVAYYRESIDLAWTELRLYFSSAIEDVKDFDRDVGVDSSAAALRRVAAVEAILDTGKRPGKTVTWDLFVDEVCDRADGWTDKKNRKTKRGFTRKTIERDVNRLPPPK